MKKLVKLKKIVAMVILIVMVLSILYPISSAEPAVEISTDYVVAYTNAGKPIWLKLSLPSGGLSVSLNPGSAVSFRLDYCFDKNLKPSAGEYLQLQLSGMPKGTFVLPSNMHTSGNIYRDGVITLNYANVGGYNLSEGITGWMTVTFYASGDSEPGTYNPRIVGNGSAENMLVIEQIVINLPGTDPGPSGPGETFYNLIRKLSEHVLIDDKNGGYIYLGYQYQIPDVPSYISYEIILNEGSGEKWTENKIGDFDYLTFTDTLGPGQEFIITDGEPQPNPWGNNPMLYGETAPVYGISISKRDPVTGVVGAIANRAIDKTDTDNIKITVSPDKKTFTLTIMKGARITGTTETIDENTTIRLDYYAKVTDPTVSSFYNKAKVEYVKNSEATSGNSNVRIDVIASTGADFIVKEVGKWGGTLGSIDGWGSHINSGVVIDRALHGADNPLIIEDGDYLVYWINYKNTGNASKTAGEVVIHDNLPTEVEIVQLRTASDAFTSIYDYNKNAFTVEYNQGQHEAIMRNTGELQVNQLYWMSFIVKVKNNVEDGKPILNTVGSNTTIVKKDGYAIQVVKQDSDTKTFLSDAKFDLYIENNGNWNRFVKNGSPVTLTTAAYGKSDIQNLPVGKYRLVETDAPAGYPAISVNNQAVIEFEILPDMDHIESIKRILIYKAPLNMGDPIDDNGTAVFTVPNSKTTPVGNLLLKKAVDEKIDNRSFYVTLTTSDGKFLAFDAAGSYSDKSDMMVQIEIKEDLPTLLKNIPLDIGAITVTETAASKSGYLDTYLINGGYGSNTFTFGERDQTIFINVNNEKSNVPPETDQNQTPTPTNSPGDDTPTPTPTNTPSGSPTPTPTPSPAQPTPQPTPQSTTQPTPGGTETPGTPESPDTPAEPEDGAEPHYNKTLPQTGIQEWPILFLCSIGSLFLAIGLWLVVKKRKRAYSHRK